MSVCRHKLELCKLKNCRECAYIGEESKCPMIEYASESDRTPTFAKMLEIYDAGGASYRRRKETISSVRRSLAAVGLAPESKASEMTRAKFRTLIASFRDEKREGGVLRDLTIETRLGAFRSISSRSLEDRYEDMGLDLPAFQIPVFKAERPPVQQVSDRQVRQFTIQIEKWLASGKPSDRDAFVYSWFALFCGMRAGDICLNRWDVLRRTDDGIMLAYEPHKTSKYKKKTSFRIDHKVFCMIEPLMKGSDEYIIPRNNNRIPKSWDEKKSCKEYRFQHNYLRNKVNRALSACGIGNEYKGQKKTHALRKYFETEMAMRFGKMVAANMACHSVQQQERSYLGTAIGKVA